MRFTRKAATQDHWTTNRAAQGVARLRAIFCGLLTVGGVAVLIAGLIQGRFENMRYLGTIVFAESPAAFVAVAMGWAVAISLFAWLTLVLWDQSRR